MEFLAWLCGSLLVLIGLIGTVAPLVPGMPLMFLGLLLLKIWLPASPFSWWSVGFAALSILIAAGIDSISAIAGAKLQGGTKWGVLGAAIGCAVGFLFLPAGLVIGPIAGAILAEILLANRTLREASASGLGTALGLGAAAILRLLLGILVVVAGVVDYFI